MNNRFRTFYNYLLLNYSNLLLFMAILANYREKQSENGNLTSSFPPERECVYSSIDSMNCSEKSIAGLQYCAAIAKTFTDLNQNATICGTIAVCHISRQFCCTSMINRLIAK